MPRLFQGSNRPAMRARLSRLTSHSFSIDPWILGPKHGRLVSIHIGQTFQEPHSLTGEAHFLSGESQKETEAQIDLFQKETRAAWPPSTFFPGLKRNDHRQESNRTARKSESGRG